MARNSEIVCALSASLQKKTLKRAIEFSDGGEPDLQVVERLSMYLALPLLTQAYAFKDGDKNPKYIKENEIRFLKIFPYGFEAIGLVFHDNRRRIIQKIDPDLSIEFITDHDE